MSELRVAVQVGLSAARRGACMMRRKNGRGGRPGGGGSSSGGGGGRWRQRVCVCQVGRWQRRTHHLTWRRPSAWPSTTTKGSTRGAGRRRTSRAEQKPAFVRSFVRSYGRTRFGASAFPPLAANGDSDNVAQHAVGGGGACLPRLYGLCFKPLPGVPRGSGARPGVASSC